MNYPKYNTINLLPKFNKANKYNTTIKLITRKQTLNPIDISNNWNMKFDTKNIPQVDVNNKIINHLKYELVPIITHLINRINKTHEYCSSWWKKIHATQTTMTQIYNKLYNKLICTDISAVYDTIEHDILYWKLDHSYLKDRKQ